MATCVEIEKNDDGTFVVTDCSQEEGTEGQMQPGMHKMPDGQMMRGDMMQGGQGGGMEGMGGEMEAQGQQVATLKDALMAAADILTKGGSSDINDKQAAFSSADERLTR